jgi:hypothetical protein
MFARLLRDELGAAGCVQALDCGLERLWRSAAKKSLD